MPRRTTCPRWALLSRFDARAWGGGVVYSRNGAPVSAPTGIFEDAVAFLNGGAVAPGLDLASRVAAAHTITNPGFPVGWLAGIDANDRVYVENDGPWPFRLSSVPALGGGVNADSVLLAGMHRATLTADWRRGNLVPDDFPAAVLCGISWLAGAPVGLAPFNVTALWRFWQDVPSLMREDATTLSAADAAPVDASWVVDERGHAILSTSGAPATISWSQDSFRDRLGFTGLETFQLGFLGAMQYLRSTYPIPGVLAPSRPLDVQDLQSSTVAPSLVLTDSTMRENLIAIHRRWVCSGYIDGPVDAWDDLHRHWHYRCTPYLHQGTRATLYQDWGDSRTATWTKAYSTTTTPEEAGYRGKIRGYLVEGIGELTSTWPQSIRRRSPLAFTLQEG